MNNTIVQIPKRLFRSECDNGIATPAFLTQQVDFALFSIYEDPSKNDPSAHDGLLFPSTLRRRTPVESLAPAFCTADALPSRTTAPRSRTAARPRRCALSRFLRLGLPDGRASWGSSISWAGRIFDPRLPSDAQGIGTLLFIHGYMSRSGWHQAPWSRTPSRAAEAVYLMDLPGHGLSDGASCDIDDFDECGGARPPAFAEAGSRRGPRNRIGSVAAGPSPPGCPAWLIEHARSRRAASRASLFGAPLVRSASWGWSEIGLFLGGAFIRDSPRGKYTGPLGSALIPSTPILSLPARASRSIGGAPSSRGTSAVAAPYPKISARLIVAPGRLRDRRRLRAATALPEGRFSRIMRRRT